MKLSIITINLNNASGLRKTIECVVGQTFTDFEYIIIDGGSTDGSVDVIKEYADKIDYWVSEPDKGIYNAMNKGILQAKGEYLQFLNSGDWLISNFILESVKNSLLEDDIIYGNGVLSFKNGSSQIYATPEKLTLDYFYSGSLFHPSTFIRRDLFITYGLYNESNKIVSDWEFFLKTTMVNSVTTKHLPMIIANAEDGGISRDSRHSNVLKEEVNSILSRYFPVNVVNLMRDYEIIKTELTWIKSKTLLKFYFYLRNIKQKYFEENLKEIFTEVYKSNYWGGDKSVSGPGSDPEATVLIQNGIMKIIKDFQIKSISDAPCGDFLWMKNVIDSCKDSIDSYTGIDIVDQLIADNKAKYAKPKVKFQVLDITTEVCPESDLIICRDCFIHLSFRNILRSLERFKDSNSKYLLLNTYTNNTRVNVDLLENKISFHPLNMQKFPFYFQSPILIINEGCTEFNGNYNDKSLALWELRNIDLKKVSFYLKLCKFKLPFMKMNHILSRIIIVLKNKWKK